MAPEDLGERIARLEGILESHEKNAMERKDSINKRLDEIVKKQDAQQCIAHAAHMIEISQNQAKIEQTLADNIKEINGRLTFTEKTLWTGLGGL